MWRKVFLNLNNGEKHLTDNPEKDILDKLVEKTKALGHQLSFDEVRHDPEMFNPMAYAYYFDSFENAARKAWHKSKSSIPDSPPKIKTLPSFMQESVPKEEKKPMYKPYVKEEVVVALRDFYHRTGKLPTKDTASKYDSGLPTFPTLVKILGPKSGWLSIIGEEGGNQSIPENCDNLKQPVDVEDIKIDTTRKETADSITIEFKITIPGRENPIIISLTV